MTTPHTHDAGTEVHVDDPAVPHAHPPAGSQVNISDTGTTYAPGASPYAKARRIVGLIFGVLVTLIGLRIVLLLLGANAGNALVDFIYGVTEPFVAPFRGVFDLDVISPTGVSILDVAALVSLVGWSLIAILIIAILRLPDRRDV
jgi:uncharacterized protein YggT (Ycf19 family)